MNNNNNTNENPIIIEDDAPKDTLINEEYKIWKKNTPFLYDLVMTHALEWPSLSVQWLPGSHVLSGGNYSTHRLLLGTHTSGGEQNQLMIANVRLPIDQSNEMEEQTKYDQDGEIQELGGYGGISGKVDIQIKILHKGEVNRARYMPQNDYILATKTNTPEIHVFDVTKHPSKPVVTNNKDVNSTNPSVQTSNPDWILTGHTKEGFGLAWNPHQKWHLISGSDDSVICEWNLELCSQNSKIDPMNKYTGHTDVIEDVDWHKFHPHLFGSVGDDKQILLWDTRNDNKEKAQSSVFGHSSEINSIHFSPFNEFLFATGSTDKNVRVWDIRQFNTCLHTLAGHSDDVIQVSWSPHHGNILASAANDRRIYVWDLSRIGEEQTPEDAEDGPPELLFIHGGHTARVSEFSWNPVDPWVIASVAEDNILQIWQMAENIYADDEEDETESTPDNDSEK